MDEQLFIKNIVAKNPLYNIIRDEEDEPCNIEIRLFIEDLWKRYQPYADPHFRQQIQVDIHARFWEMYLTCAFLDKSLHVKNEDRGRGPDILIEDGTSRIWVEAIAPSSGADGNPDQVPDFENGVPTPVPDEQIIIRYRSAIREKFDNKYRDYLAAGYVSYSDPYVIAINSCKIRAAIGDTEPPQIVKAVFPVGLRKITISNETKKIVDLGFQVRTAIKRSSGAEISTDLFLNQSYQNLSGIIFSRASVGRLVEPLGADFIFIHNPLAKNPVPTGFFKRGREYTASECSDSYVITCEDWNIGD